MPTLQNIVSLFAAAAQRVPDREALIIGRERITYGSLLKRVQGRAAEFSIKGLRPGDRVLVFVPIGIALYTDVLALLWMGAVPVFVDEWAGRKRLAQCCTVAAPKALLAPRRYLLLSYFLGSLRRIPLKLRSGVERRKGVAEMHPATAEESTLDPVKMHPAAAEDPALITFTTGSTGTPKAAVRTHGILHGQFRALSPLIERDCDRCLTLLPIVVLLYLALGHTTLLSRISPKNHKPGDSDALLRYLQREGGNSVVASPFLLTEIAKSELHSPMTGLAILRAVTGGGPLSVDAAAKIVRAFPTADLTCVYGSTEAEPIAHLSLNELAVSKPERTGLPAGRKDPAATVAILPWQQKPWQPMNAAEWNATLLPTDAVGEIVVSGDHVVEHYWQNDAAGLETKIRVDGKVWHRTGDAGRLTPDAQLYLYGRCEAVWWAGSQSLYPFVIEGEALSFTGVEAAAFFIHDAAPCLCYTTSSGFSSDGFTSRIREVSPLIRLYRLPQIPLDPRHRTKPDFAALKRILAKS